MGGDRWEASVAGYRVVVEPPYVTLSRGAWRLDVNMVHVHAVEVDRSLKWVFVGLLLVIVAVGVYRVAPRVELELASNLLVLISLVTFVTGVATAVYGWLNRYVLVIHYGGGKAVLRDGGKIVELAEHVRASVRRVALQEASEA